MQASILAGHAALLLILAGCPAAASGGASNRSTPESPERESAVTAPASDSLRLRLQAPDTVRAGEPVPIRIRLENVSGRTLDLYLRGRTIAFDVVVSRADGEVVWRRLEGEIIPAILRIETLPPGETLELEASWDQRTNRGEPAGPGLYRVQGLVLTDQPEPLSTPTEELRIVPR